MKRTSIIASGLLLAGGLILLGVGGPAGPPAASGATLEYSPVILPRPGVMHVGMDILVGAESLRTIPHAGRTYLPVPRLGEEYTIRIWNHGPRRITAVVSVDGLSVISGKPAAETDTGYIVDPHSSILIKGWRRSMDAVAAFRFVDREKSYAKAMGRPENVGVIGLVAFEEMAPMPPLAREAGDRAAMSSKHAPAAGVGSVGTGYGREVDSRVYSVPFVRSANRRALTYFYDTEEALRKAGVPVDFAPPPLPTPFPGEEFAPPPPGYKAR
jgi:hypothetical protein